MLNWESNFTQQKFDKIIIFNCYSIVLRIDIIRSQYYTRNFFNKIKNYIYEYNYKSMQWKKDRWRTQLLKRTLVSTIYLKIH